MCTTNHVSTTAHVKQDTDILAVYANIFSSLSSYKYLRSITGLRRQWWQNQISMTVTQNQLLNQDCFAVTSQTNINNACKWDFCSTWLLLNQLLPVAKWLKHLVQLQGNVLWPFFFYCFQSYNILIIQVFSLSLCLHSLLCLYRKWRDLSPFLYWAISNSFKTTYFSTFC